MSLYRFVFNHNCITNSAFNTCWLYLFALLELYGGTRLKYMILPGFLPVDKILLDSEIF